MNAKYIVIEGLEGAGKTSARDVLVSLLRQNGINDVLFTREPGGTALAEQIRQMILSIRAADEEALCDISELLLFYAARVQLVENVIKPALAQGTWVIGDRHDLSTQAYQGGGRGVSQQLLSVLRQLALGDFAPQLTLYLDVEPETGLQRASARGQLDRIEQETLAFFQRTRVRYQQLAQQNPDIITINAMQPLQQVQQQIREETRRWLQAHNR